MATFFTVRNGSEFSKETEMPPNSRLFIGSPNGCDQGFFIYPDQPANLKLPPDIPEDLIADSSNATFIYQDTKTLPARQMPDHTLFGQVVINRFAYGVIAPEDAKTFPVQKTDLVEFQNTDLKKWNNTIQIFLRFPLAKAEVIVQVRRNQPKLTS